MRAAQLRQEEMLQEESLVEVSEEPDSSIEANYSSQA